jgi:signal transduction histidine kinase
VNFLARFLDRLSWPVLIVASVALVALAVAVSLSVEVDLPFRKIARMTIDKPAEPAQPAADQPPPAVPDTAPSPSAPLTIVVPSPPIVQPQIPQDLQERIRKRVHDELARVQGELEKAQQDAMREQEDQRRDAEDTVRQAQQAYQEAQNEYANAMREAAKEYAERRRSIQREYQDEDTDAGRKRELDKEQRDALKQLDNVTRNAQRELHRAKDEMDRAIGEAKKQIARHSAHPGEVRVEMPEIHVPNINFKIPDIRIPELNTLAKVKPAPPAPAQPAVPAAPAAPAVKPPAAPLSNDAMIMVERDVGSAVADTVGQEVHSALKGYRLALSGMLVGVALLLTAGAVIGKTVMTSARAARARADLLRVEAERNLMSRQVVEAQLKMMQAQVEPHFLFNTLANVRFLQDSDPAGAGRMLDHLIDYLHAALPQMRESSTTLAQETELARAYLEILRIRMGGRLAFAIQMPQDLMNVSFPPMMLLSLVENAIKHGLEPMREGGRIDIEAAADAGRLRLAVKDTGAGLGSGAESEAGSGVGLANIRERLKTLFGESAQLTLQENQPHGVIATIEIPL